MSAPIGPGDWVQCVDASPPAWPNTGGLLVLGGVYCVEGIVKGLRLDGSFHPGLILTDPATKSSAGLVEHCWRLERFVPLGGRRADFIEALKQPAPEREREDA